MIITKTKEGGVITLAINGKLSTPTSQQFQEALIPAFTEAKRVVLDFSEVDYVASAGLRVLFAGHEAAAANESSMVLRGVSEEIMEILEMTGFSNFLTIE